MIKNILFIIPPFGSIESYSPKFPGQKKPQLTIPYGILSIAAFVNKEKDYSIDIFDYNKIILENINELNIEQILLDKLEKKIKSFTPDCIGVSALFNTNFPFLDVSTHIKKLFPKVFITVGGGLATNMYKEIFDKYPEVDAICYGEGEIPFKKLLRSDNIDDISKLSCSWITKKSIERDQLPSYDFVENLNEIPLIDLSYIDHKKYNSRSYVDRTETKVEISIHTSRGCCFNCIFCANGKVHGKRIRSMSLDKILETIRTYKEKYDLTLLLIEDDHFLHSKEKAISVLDFIAENKINVEFPNGLTVYKIDEDIAKALSKAKVKLITLAIESGSDFILKNVIDKPLSTSKITQAVKYLQQYSIRIHAFVVIGIPGELDVHREESLKFLVSLNLDWVYVFIATPIVGSRLYALCKENNYLLKNNDFGNHVVTRGNIIAPSIFPDKMEKYAYYMHIILNCFENSNMKKGRLDIAEEYFLRVLTSYPKESIIHYMLSIIYTKKEDFNKKEYHYKMYRDNYEEYVGRFRDSELWKTIDGYLL